MTKTNFKKIFVEENVFDEILGQKKTKQQIKSALLMDRHIIIVGPPGVGKTTIAKNISKLLPEIEVNDCEYHCSPGNPLCPGCKSKKPETKKIKGADRFIRIQGSPELSVEDLLGDIDPIKALKFGPMSIEAFTPGKIFKANNGVLFFDEINRCSEKLQNALLQVLEERHATIGSYYVDLPADFIFIGTMNPEDSSTEKLSEVFLDRFDLVYMSYPESIETEIEIVTKKGKRLDVSFPNKLLMLTINFIRYLRNSDKLSKHPGVRASLGLYERAQANCYLDKRKEVLRNDIMDSLLSVLSHRIELKPSFKYLQSPTDFIISEFHSFIKDFDDNIIGGDP